MSTRETMLGFLIGAAAGGLAGVLMAPASGKTTRKKMKKKGKKAVAAGERQLESAKAAIDERSTEYVESVKGILDDVSQGSRAHAHAVKDAANGAKTAYRDSLESA